MKRTIMSVVAGTFLTAGVALAQDGGRDGVAQRLPWSDAPRGNVEAPRGKVEADRPAGPGPSASSRPTGPGTEYDAILGYVDARLKGGVALLETAFTVTRLVTPSPTPTVMTRLHDALEALRATATRYGKATPEATAAEVLARLSDVDAVAQELDRLLGAASSEVRVGALLRARREAVAKAAGEPEHGAPGVGTRDVLELLEGARHHLAALEVVEARACHDRAAEALARHEARLGDAVAVAENPTDGGPEEGLRFTGRYTPEGRMIFRSRRGVEYQRVNGRFTRLDGR